MVRSDEYPDPVKEVLAGFRTSGANLKTASESAVHRYVCPGTGDARFLKIQRPSWSPPLSLERDAMVWLSGRIPVPRVVAYHKEGDTEYLVTRALPGISAENPDCHADKQQLVERLAKSLRKIHALEVGDCPLDRRPAALIEAGRRRIEAGIVTDEMVVEAGLSGTPAEALDDLVASAPDPDTFVFTHGDYCLPNVMIHDGAVSGFIDLGYAGVGDPYRDFTAARYSIRRNLGEDWITSFFQACGIDPDEQKLEWYRRIQVFH